MFLAFLEAVMNFSFTLINEDFFQVPQKFTTCKIPGGSMTFLTPQFFLITRIIFSHEILKYDRKVCARTVKENLKFTGEKLVLSYSVPALTFFSISESLHHTP